MLFGSSGYDPDRLNAGAHASRVGPHRGMKKLKLVGTLWSETNACTRESSNYNMTTSWLCRLASSFVPQPLPLLSKPCDGSCLR
jgi:hypothetical protein